MNEISHQPTDRQTRVCDAMINAFDAHPEHHEDDRCIVFLTDNERGGIAAHKYEDVAAAMADLLMHLRAMMRAVGKDLEIVFLNDNGVDTL